jgi:hypothetical protein
MKRAFKVTLEIPKGATVADCRAYIEDWVGSGCGAHRPPGSYGDDDPGDPMWGLDRDSIKVVVPRHRRSKSRG